MFHVKIVRLLLLFVPYLAVAQQVETPVAATVQTPLETEEQTQAERGKRIQFVGFAGDVLNGKQNYDSQIQSGGNPLGGRAENVDHIIQVPRFSLLYQRQLLLAVPQLYGEVQVRAFRRQEDRSSDFMARLGENAYEIVGPTEISEQIDLFNLYLYPGLNYFFGKNREILAYIGGGAAIAYPLNSSRTITFKSDNYPDQPKTQTVDPLQEVSYGYYGQIGFQMNFPVGLGIGFVLRQESLEQLWAQEPRAQVINTRNFVTNDILTEKSQFMFQGQIYYSW